MFFNLQPISCARIPHASLIWQLFMFCWDHMSLENFNGTEILTLVQWIAICVCSSTAGESFFFQVNECQLNAERVISSLVSLLNYFQTHLVSITWHLIYHYDELVMCNLAHLTLTEAINRSCLKAILTCSTSLVSASSLIVRINGCWTMTFSAIQQTGKPHWLDCILLWYYHLAFVCVHTQAHTNMSRPWHIHNNTDTVIQQ